MSQQKSSSVSYAESLMITGKRVGEFIQKEIDITRPTEILLATCSGGKPHGPQETEAYGFLLATKSRSFFERLMPKPRDLIANLWFTNEARRATHKKWVLEVFGREHVDFFKELADKLSKQFETEIHIRLESELPQQEYISGGMGL